MDIVIGKWYKFETPLDKGAWLNIVSGYLEQPIDYKLYVNKDALRLSHTGTINYRTNLNPNYPPIKDDVEVWHHDGMYPGKVVEHPTKTQLMKEKMNAFYGRSCGKTISQMIVDENPFGPIDEKVMEEYKMENGKNYFDKALVLLREARNQETTANNMEVDKVRDEFIKSTEIGKLAVKMSETINKINEDAKTTWEGFFMPHFLPKEEREKLDEINRSRCEKDAALDAKYTEIEALLKMADTFQEAQTILRDYGIIKGPKTE